MDDAAATLEAGSSLQPGRGGDLCRVHGIQAWTELRAHSENEHARSRARAGVHQQLAAIDASATVAAVSTCLLSCFRYSRQI